MSESNVNVADGVWAGQDRGVRCRLDGEAVAGRGRVGAAAGVDGSDVERVRSGSQRRQVVLLREIAGVERRAVQAALVLELDRIGEVVGPGERQPQRERRIGWVGDDRLGQRDRGLRREADVPAVGRRCCIERQRVDWVDGAYFERVQSLELTGVGERHEVRRCAVGPLAGIDRALES